MTTWQKFILVVLALAGASAMLAGCSGSGTVIEERVITANRPVIQPCVDEAGRPAAVTTLKQDLPDEQWQAMDVKQKSAAVGRKGLEHRQYGEQLGAATGSCP